MTISDADMKKHKLKMLQMIGNKIFVEPPFLAEKDKTLSLEQRFELFQYGRQVAEGARLKRWEQYFTKQTIDTSIELAKPWKDMESAQTTAQFVKAYNQAIRNGDVNVQPTAIAKRKKYIIKALEKCRTDKDIETIFNTVGLDIPQAISTFVKDNISSVVDIIELPKIGTVFLNKVLESNALDDETQNQLVCRLIRNGDFNYLSKHIKQFEPSIKTFNTDVVCNYILDEILYEDYYNKMDIPTVFKGLELLKQIQNKIEWTDNTGVTPSTSVVELIMNTSLYLATSTRTKDKKLEILDQLWSYVNELPLNRDDVEKQLYGTYMSDLQAAKLPELFDYIARVAPDAELILEESGDLNTKALNELHNILLINQKAYPNVIANIDDYLEDTDMRAKPVGDNFGM